MKKTFEPNKIYFVDNCDRNFVAEFSETKDKNKFLLKTYDVEAGTNTPCINFSIVLNHGKNEFFKGSKAFNGCGAEELFNTDDITITKYAYEEDEIIKLISNDKEVASFMDKVAKESNVSEITDYMIEKILENNEDADDLIKFEERITNEFENTNKTLSEKCKYYNILMQAKKGV